MKANELAAELVAVRDQVAKAKEEILAKIGDLEELELPSEAVDALNALKAKVQEMDDIVPDAPPPA